MKKLNSKGMIDHTLIAVIIGVVVVVGAVYWRVSTSRNNKASVETAQELQNAEVLPNNLEGIKSFDEIKQIAGVSDNSKVIGLKLETKDGVYVYIISLSDGRKLTINATTGEIISSENSDSDSSTKAGVSLSPSEAYAMAAAKSSSPIKKIELEVEDTKATYKIEYADGSKIEIDATSGTVLKSEIKSESSSDRSGSDDSSSEDSHESESSESSDSSKETEDKHNEDSNDSKDSPDHAEEDN